MKTAPIGYHARSVEISDAPAVASIIRANEIALTGHSRTTTATVENDWLGLDLPEETVCLVDEEGRVAAYADVMNRSYRIVNVYQYVDLDHRSSGLASWLIAWGEEWIADRIDRASEGARVVTQHFVKDADSDYARLVEHNGYRPVRTVYVMERDFPATPVAVPNAAGYRIREYRPGIDDLSAHLAFEEGAADMWERPRSTLEVWQRVVKRSDNGLLLLAEEEASGDIAAVCTCTLADGEGWIGGLAVVPAHRRKGVGLAILTAGFEALRSRGATTVGLSVDSESPTGAGRLYERAGMQVVESYTVYRKVIREGSIDF